MPDTPPPFRFWSPSAHGFFAPDHAAIPEDAVPISAARHAELMHAQATIGPIWSDGDGLPQPATPEEQG